MSTSELPASSIAGASPPRLMAITNLTSRSTGPGELESWIEDLVAHQVDALQVREKSLDDLDLLSLARRIVRAAGGRLRVLINGRPDLAVAAGADGVHLPSRGLPPKIVRRRWPSLLLGFSAHQVEEIEDLRGDLDFVTFSPVFATSSKARYGAPQGLDRLAAACQVGVPVVALGGVTAGCLTEVAGAGARGAAAIRAFQDPASLVEMASQAERLWPSR